MRTTTGRRRVDVIYRRVDDEFLDPVVFRADSALGCPGVMACARTGTVTIANAVGNGVADDKLVYSYVPDLIRYYLGEEPLLASVDTWRLEEPAALEEVLDRLEELVVKPVDGSGGKGIVIGPAGRCWRALGAAGPVAGRPARLDRPARDPAVHGAHARRGRPCARGTSTCARSRSTTATTSGCCPAG